MKKSILDRDRPRKIYVNEQIWRDIKAECAKEGISISKWFREEAKKKIGFILLLAFIVGGMVFTLSPYEVKRQIVSTFEVFLTVK